MNSSYVEQFQVLQAKPRLSGSRIGAIVALEHGPIVDFPGNPFGPQRARIAASVTGEALSAACANDLPVLLVFESDDPSRPVIVDIVIEYPGDGPSSETPIAGRDDGRVGGNAQPELGGAQTGLARILAVQNDVVMVEDMAHVGQPVAARTAVTLRNLKDPVVLLRFADGAAVIVGQVYPFIPMEPAGGDGADVLLKGNRVRIEADVELVLAVGACRVQLDARGKAVTTADQIVSRARGCNKVQGGTVQLN